MSSNFWNFGVSGNWLDGTRWSAGAPPAAGDDVFFEQTGPYTVALASAVTINSLTFDAAGATLTEPPGGSLNVAGAVTLDVGTLALAGANTMGSVNESGGLLELYDAKALGAATLTLTGGEVTGMATEAVANPLSLGGSGFTIDAATGASVDFGGGGWSLATAGDPVIQFGSPSRRGTVIWQTGGGSTIVGASAYTVDVAGGVLRAGDSSFGLLLQNAASTTVAAGARIDLNGANAQIADLGGSGDIVDSGAPSSLAIKGGFFLGAIGGPIAVDYTASTELAGANTYTGGTTIDSGVNLYLAGGARIAGAITDNGTLYNLETSGQVVLGAISGSGVLDQQAASTLVLDQASSFSGGTNILAGRVSIGNGAALGTGTVVVAGGQLVASATLTMPDSLTLRDTVTLAAATGKTLNLTGGGFTLWDANAAPLTVIFGDGLDKGTVLLDNGSLTVNFANPIHIEVAAGTLKLGDPIFDSVTSNSGTDTKVMTDATLDLGGFSIGWLNLTSTGTITNSAATEATLETEGVGAIGGSVTGKVNLAVVSGITTLTGVDNASGGTTIASGTELQLGAGGTAGTLAGPIDDQGAFHVVESGKVALAGVISGAGFVVQQGKGATTLSGVNTYGGGTDIYGGVLVADGAAALGTGGTIAIMDGELLGGANETLSHDLATLGTATLAAAHATTLTLATANATFGAGTVVFGAAGQDGTVILEVSSSITVASGVTVEVRAGTVKAGDAAGLDDLVGGAATTAIDAGATLNGGGHILEIANLTGVGTLTNFGGATLVIAGVSSFAGVVTGNCNLDIAGTTTLSGNETFNGKATISDQALTVSGLFKEDVVFNGGLLILPTPANFTGRIGGFASGSTIDLRNITKGATATVSYDAATHVVTVSDGTHTDHLTFLGGYVLGNFKATSDYGGGTNITWQTPPSAVSGGTGGPSAHQVFAAAMAGFAAPAGAGPSCLDDQRHQTAAVLAAPAAAV